MCIIKMGAQRRHDKTDDNTDEKTQRQTDWKGKIAKLNGLSNNRG